MLFIFYFQDWPRYCCVEPLRAIQRKRETGFLPCNKEEKEKISNGEDVSHVWMQYFMHMSFDVCLHTVSPLPFKCLMRWP